MNGIILTKNSTPIIGQVAQVLGMIMEGIFNLIDLIGIPNVGLAIILFTIVVNLLMLPITIKQQKFSKLSAKMNPEIQAIQEKYKNKKDNDSQMAMNTEIQAVYSKYGVSPTGSCMYLLIQMPILLALYRVIYAMPAYVGKIKEAFFPLVTNIINTEGATELVQGFSNSAMYAKQFSNESFVAGDAANVYVQNTLIDCLNKASTADFASISEKFPSLANDVANAVEKLGTYNNFLGLNIGNSPQYLMNEAINNGAWLVAAAALIIPVLSAVTQWINVKLMPQQENDGKKSEQAQTMASSMKTMNMIMPIISAWMCFTLPSGMGLYWVAGSVVRSIQQIIINRHLDKMDFEDIIRKNKEKSAKKTEKMKEQQEKLNAYANMNTKNIKAKANVVSNNSVSGQNETNEEKSGNVKAGSMMEKANMVRKYNEKNNK